jgi:preprotein translocase subunit SecA
MDTLGIEEDEPIEHKWITKAVENAQKRVEGHNFEIRKHLLDFDNVMNVQRDVIYTMRRDVMQGENLREAVLGMLNDVCEDMALQFCGEGEVIPPDEFDWKGLEDIFYQQFGYKLDFIESKPSTTLEEFQAALEKNAIQYYENKEEKHSKEFMRHVERVLLLETIDFLWKDHLLAIDHLKEGINLRAYAQKDPILEYKKEAFTMFKAMTFQIKANAMAKIFRAQGISEDEMAELQHKQQKELKMIHGQLGKDKAEAAKPATRAQEKVGRNDPCPCGSEKKFKKCCGK